MSNHIGKAIAKDPVFLVLAIIIGMILGNTIQLNMLRHQEPVCVVEATPAQ